MLFWTPHFSVLDSTFFVLDSTFWLDSTLKIDPVRNFCRMFVLRERLKPTSEQKSVSCGNTFQIIRSTLYAKKLKRVDELHVGKNSL